MGKKEKDVFARACKEHGVRIADPMSVSNVATVADVHPSTVRRDIEHGHLAAFRRVPRGRLWISLDDAVRYVVEGVGG